MNKLNKALTRRFYTLHWVLFFVLLQSCTSLNTFDTLASLSQDGLSLHTIFKHQTLYAESLNKNDHLAIFIEGDGTPWIKNKHIAKDPSPDNPLLLKFIKQYSGNLLYLGRPCYFNTHDPLCHFKYWTSHRYNEQVVKSMVLAVKETLKVKKYKRLTLVGHSGGGTLARLMACEFNIPVNLITLAANLDTNAWTKHHGWTPLFGSLNPVHDTKPCPNLNESHFHGDLDKVVPMHLNDKYFETHQINQIVVENQNHTDWSNFWPTLNQILPP